MITIKNTQHEFAINTEQVKQDLLKILDALNYGNFDVTVWFTDNPTIQEYNRNYRHKDKATDILSFPYHPTLQAGQKIKVQEQEDRNLGDMIISVEYTKCDAERLKVTLEQRIKKLLVHGVCHLLGYDHIEEHDWRRMRAKEGWLLKKIN